MAVSATPGDVTGKGGGDPLRVVIDGYAGFLRERQLAPPRQQPHLVRWVEEFLIFAWEHRGYTFEQTLDAFLAEVGQRTGALPWQVRQAGDAVRIYRYQYRRAGGEGDPALPAGPGPPDEPRPADDSSVLGRLREVIRLRTPHDRALRI